MGLNIVLTSTIADRHLGSEQQAEAVKKFPMCIVYCTGYVYVHYYILCVQSVYVDNISNIITIDDT